MFDRRARVGWSLAAGLFALAAGAGAEIFVSSNDRIRVFADDADGAAAPLRTIELSPAPFSDLCCLAIDLPRRELYAADDNGIRVFALNASGPSTPLRAIVGANTGFTGPRGVAVDTVHDELFVADTDSHLVRVFARTADGNVAPLRSLGGAASFGVDGYPVLVFLDLVHDELFVSVRESGNARIYVFDRTASGNATPKRTLTSVDNPRSVVVDLEHDELVVTEYDLGWIRVFDRTATGDAATKRVISGANTKLDQPYELTILEGDELLAGQDGFSDGSVVGFLLASDGDASPTRYLAGAETLLEFPVGVVSTRAKECSADRVVDGCLFAEGFEGGDACAWSGSTGGPACG